MPFVELKSYVGFFSLLWFTWFQVALYDVRFGHDSVFERVCKAIQFGVMVGLAVEGPNYDLENFSYHPFRSLSLVLMVSRLVLAIQYAVAWWLLWDYKKARLPLLTHIVTMFVSAMAFLGMAFAFAAPHGVHVIDGWYALIGVEAVTILFVSGKTPFLNFRKTNIIERLGLLTLIILGEGVMGLGEAVSKIHDADGIFSADVVGLITCGVLIVYFLYMLYFDQTEEKGEKVGSLRQQLWSLGHFPFHVCILLVVAGFSQFIIWRRIIDYLNLTSNEINNVPQPTSSATAAWRDYASAVNATLMIWWPGLDFTDPLTDIANSDGNMDYIVDGYYAIWGIVAQFVAEDYFEVEVPSGFNNTQSEGFNDLVNILSLYSTAYLYFFISAGFALVILACLFMLGQKAKTRVEYLSIGVRLFVGTGIILLATIYAPVADNANDNAFINYFLSPWLTPTVVLAYALGKSKSCLNWFGTNRIMQWSRLIS